MSNPIYSIPMPTKKLKDFGLYFITDSNLTKKSVIYQVKSALKAGVKIIQYREKKLPTLEMYAQAKEIRRLTKNKAIFIINDRVDICLAVNADGVHLGNDDIPYRDARKLLKDKIIGISTHNIQEALHAEKLGADYISIGPIFATKTKSNHQKPIGTSIIRELLKKIKIPFVAIGGINENNIKNVVNAGAKNVAMISGIVTKEDIEKEMKKIMGYLRSYMDTNDLVRIGSETAKGGFANERMIAEKFENWRLDKEAQKWLKIMNYNLEEIEKVETVILHGYKADIQVKVIVTLKRAISVQNLSIKKANSDADFNQIDKRWVKNYIEMWNIPNDIVILLKIFCGEISPKQLLKEGKITKQKYDSLRDKRRFFIDEFGDKHKKVLIDFFNKNKLLIITDIIKGRDKFAADWMLVAKYDKKKDETTWGLADINKAMSIFGEGEVKISPRGSIAIGRVTLQRKGGDGGRATGNMLQFKIRPCDLFRY